MAADGGVGDAGGGGAHEDFALGVVFAYEGDEAFLDVGADFGGGEGEAVVTVDGAVDAACPSKGVVGTEEDGSDGEEVVGDLLRESHNEES